MLLPAIITFIVGGTIIIVSNCCAWVRVSMLSFPSTYIYIVRSVFEMYIFYCPINTQVVLILAIITFIVGGTILSCAWVRGSVLSFHATFNLGKLKANLSNYMDMLHKFAC